MDKPSFIVELELTQAFDFAFNAHEDAGQLRQGQSYIIHPLEVAELVVQVNRSRPVLQACLLHDVVEDTMKSLSRAQKLAILEEKFGKETASLVDWLSDVSTPSDGSRKERKALDRAHIAQAPADAQTIKVADVISNTSKISEDYEDFAKVYLPEKLEVLKVLTLAHPELRQLAWDQVTLRMEERGIPFRREIKLSLH